MAKNNKEKINPRGLLEQMFFYSRRALLTADEHSAVQNIYLILDEFIEGALADKIEKKKNTKKILDEDLEDDEEEEEEIKSSEKEK